MISKKVKGLASIVIFVFSATSISLADIATFEDVNLPEESFWNGSNGSGGFFSDEIFFNNSYNSTWDSWEGFSCSNVSDTLTDGMSGQYNAIAGSGQAGTSNFAICYVGWSIIPTITFEKSQTIHGLFITNNNTTYYSLLNGSAFSKKFGGSDGSDPDWLIVTITGKDDEDIVTGQVDFYLADYRFDDNTQDYIVETWQYVDLTSLGQVKSLELSMSSSDTGDFGMNTPAYFALDTVISSSDIETAGPYTEAGVNGYINPQNHNQHSSPQSMYSIVNPIFKGWATEVIDYYQTPGVDFRWSEPTSTLGPATGSVIDIFSLGDLSREQIQQGHNPGWITLTFEEPIRNGKGYDFAVFENGLISEFSSQDGSVEGQMLAELAYVEVSSNGEDFVRFPTVSLTEKPGTIFGTLETSNLYNLAGKHPNAYETCTGTPFDLQEIAENPLVESGIVDINDIKFVRIVDIPGTGGFYDQATEHTNPNTLNEWTNYLNNHPIFDAWNTSLVPLYPSGGFDLEAIGVLHEQQYSADIDLNGIVDLYDFVLFASAWHTRFGQTGWIGRCDLAEPKDMYIDEVDFDAFMSQWLQTELWYNK